MTREERMQLRELVNAAMRRRLRTATEAKYDLVCCGCGTDYDDYTTGCRPCMHRRRRRRLRGTVTHRECAGCAGPLNECSPGCKQCYERIAARERANLGQIVTAA